MVGDGTNNDGATITVPKEQWEQMQQTIQNVTAKLDVFDKMGPNFGQPAAPTVPAAPSGPSVDEQVADLDTQIDTLEDEMEAAYKDDKPTKEIRKKINNLIEKKASLRNDARFNQFAQQGLGMISQLTDSITSGKMPMLSKVPEVKREYDRIISNMAVEQRANPASLKAAYDLACGTNIDKIREVEREEWQRDLTEGKIEVQLPGMSAPGKITTLHNPPPPKVNIGEKFGKDAEDALVAVGNRNPDRIAQAFGFKDAEDYAAFSEEADEYELTGKRASQEGGK